MVSGPHDLRVDGEEEKRASAARGEGGGRETGGRERERQEITKHEKRTDRNAKIGERYGRKLKSYHKTVMRK